MTEVTTVTTAHSRKITVQPGWMGEDSRFLGVEDSRYPNKKEQAILSGEDVRKVAGALLGNNSVVIGNLPEATRDKQGYVKVGWNERHESGNPDDMETAATNLLAIAKFIRKANVEKEAAEAKRVAEAEAAAKAEKAREDKLTARRDELATEFLGNPVTYESRTKAYKQAIDRVIELEDAAAPKFSL